MSLHWQPRGGARVKVTGCGMNLLLLVGRFLIGIKRYLGQLAYLKFLRNVEGKLLKDVGMTKHQGEPRSLNVGFELPICKITTITNIG